LAAKAGSSPNRSAASRKSAASVSAVIRLMLKQVDHAFPGGGVSGSRKMIRALLRS
jgi:hypothetical protein